MRNEGEDQQSGMSMLEIVRQATAALTKMNVERLEDLAQCCEDLNPSSLGVSLARCGGFVSGWNGCQDDFLDIDLRVLGQILEETRANLSLLERLRVSRIASTTREGEVRSSADVARRRDREVFSWEQSIQP